MQFWKGFYIAEIFFPPTVTVINASILMFLYRVFHLLEFKRWVLGTGVVLLFWGTTAVCRFFERCSRSALWSC